jgi:hypothetical protein
MSKKAKMGRPKLPKDERRGVFSVRFTPAERAAIDLAAKSAGMGPTEWARQKLLGGINEFSS